MNFGKSLDYETFDSESFDYECFDHETFDCGNSTYESFDVLTMKVPIMSFTAVYE